ncbi:acylphosphatase [Methylomarinovum tepidoasis]|uniref:acylphosphatase n=1 Tax=Methylomarinovum tepidoasis TaxID=2840183 RepID=A0AAU9C7A8_9GAMM|nr:acylphosphatase [Methylomarinovum sp. IN45]BCX87677.1 acylphosphatase [Methylomarinovum sp. IN45]
MAQKRWHIWVSGRVQGVFYRAHTVEAARRLGLTGWVRNLPDGRVEIVAEGEEKALQALLDWCRQGPPLARVTEVVWRDEGPATGESHAFGVRG